MLATILGQKLNLKIFLKTLRVEIKGGFKMKKSQMIVQITEINLETISKKT